MTKLKHLAIELDDLEYLHPGAELQKIEEKYPWLKWVLEGNGIVKMRSYSTNLTSQVVEVEFSGRTQIPLDIWNRWHELKVAIPSNDYDLMVRAIAEEGT